MHSNLKKSRDEWVRISKNFFYESKKWLKYGTIIQWIAFFITRERKRNKKKFLKQHLEEKEKSN